MKNLRLPVLLLGAGLLLSSGVFAADANKGTLQLSDNVTVQGKSLNYGKYTVEWNGAGSTVQVTILQGKQTVATFSAHLTEQPTPNPGDAYGTIAGADGSRTLTTFYPAHKRFALELDQNGANSQQPAATPSSK
jgi:hypothetical protein